MDDKLKNVLIVLPEAAQQRPIGARDEMMDQIIDKACELDPWTKMLNTGKSEFEVVSLVSGDGMSAQIRCTEDIRQQLKQEFPGVTFTTDKAVVTLAGTPKKSPNLKP